VPTASPPRTPPFCPNPDCRFHRQDRQLWRFVKIGFYSRDVSPKRIQRYRCDTCRRRFSDQTFSTTYWLRRPDLLAPTFHRLVACSGFRQIAREFGVSPSTVALHAARLGRHSLLFHERNRPKRRLEEPIALDSFESFEWSQFYPTSYHLAVGQRSHFVYGWTESECRRRGTMTERQKRRRIELEATLGRPNPKAVELDVAALLSIVTARSERIELHTDELAAYARALRRIPGVRFEHRTISSRAARTAQNPLFPVNLLDLLLRHSGANHKRETIAFSKRRASAIERIAIFVVWRNWVKSFSERRRGTTPAMRLALVERPLTAKEVLAERLFASRISLPDRWQPYYWRTTPTRALPRLVRHTKRYAA
jgi:transposase-like protein